MPETVNGWVGQDSPVPPSPTPGREPLAYPAPTRLPAPPEPPPAPRRVPAYPTPAVPTSAPQPRQLVHVSASTIATLPPLEPDAEQAYPLSARTGEPSRPLLLLVAIVLCWISVACTVAAFAWWWSQAAHIPTFPTSARLLQWTNPDPVSALAIVMVILVGIIALLMVAAAGTTAYNSWAGQRWIRVAGLVCLGVTGLSFLLNWWFSVAMIPLAIGVGLLWLPPATRFFSAMSRFHTVEPVQVETTGIKYGPQPLIGAPD